MKNPRKTRIASAAVVVASFVAAFATLGGIGVAESAVSAIQKQYGKEKVTLCHKGKTITVGKPAAAAHVRHGDYVGTCAQAAKAKKAKAAKAKAKAAKAKAKAEQEQASGSEDRSKGKGKGKGK